MSDDFDYEGIITKGFKRQARILGESLHDAFDIRTSTIKYSDAMDEYAALLGRSADTLTDGERSVAMLRASMKLEDRAE